MLNEYFTESCLSLLLKHNPRVRRIPPEFPSTPITLVVLHLAVFTSDSLMARLSSATGKTVQLLYVEVWKWLLARNRSLRLRSQ
jgi:hypothetical protein